MMEGIGEPELSSNDERSMGLDMFCPIDGSQDCLKCGKPFEVGVTLFYYAYEGLFVSDQSISNCKMVRVYGLESLLEIYRNPKENE
jgi:hypothetical protein